MYQISNECKKAINHYSRELYSKAYINNNEIYASDIISYEINEGIISGSDFELGGAVASTLEIKINNLHGAYNDIELNGKEIKIFTGILLEDNSIEYVPMGIFIIDEAVKDKNIIVIEATDKMVTLEDYYESKLTFPTTVLNIANEICTIAGITLATKQFYNSNYIVDSLPAGITLRDVIHDIAEIAEGFAKINRVGELEIITPGTIVATEINKDRYIDLQIKEGFYVDKLTIVENYFPVEPIPINLNVLPFTSKWQGDFSLDCGDKVRLNDGKGIYETIITKQKITFNGGLRYESECTGLSEQQKSTQQISNTEKTNKRYKSEIKQLANEISMKVSSGDFEAYKIMTDNKIQTGITGIENILSDNLIKNGSFKIDFNGWSKSGTITNTRSTYNNKTWANVYSTNTTAVGSLTHEFESSENKEAIFTVLIAQYSSSKKLYRLRIEGYTEDEEWQVINEFTGETEGTRTNPETLEYKFSTSSLYKKYRVGVFKVADEIMDIYVTDFRVIIESSIVKKTEFEMLENKVATKVSENEFSTLVEQNAYAVKIAWNNNSKYVQFENGGLSIYDGSVTDSKKRAVFDQNGNHFWRDGYYLGKIGTNQYTGNTAIKGINFDLEYDGGYMTWAVKKSTTASTYTMMWAYANKAIGNYTAGKLHAGCDIDMHNYYLRNVNFEGGGINGTLVFTQIVGMNTDGTAARWYNNSKLVFQNGILIDATWGSA